MLFEWSVSLQSEPPGGHSSDLISHFHKVGGPKSNGQNVSIKDKEIPFFSL